MSTALNRLKHLVCMRSAHIDQDIKCAAVGTARPTPRDGVRIATKGARSMTCRPLSAGLRVFLSLTNISKES